MIDGSEQLEVRGETALLLARHDSGDPDAFARLYERHASAIRRAIAARSSRRVRELVEIDDLVQEAFLRAWQYIGRAGAGRMPGIRCFRALLVTAALRALQDLRRREARLRRDAGRTEPLDVLHHEIPSPEPRPVESARAKELSAVREQAFHSLMRRDREVLELRDEVGFSYSEVAVRMNCKPENAKLRYFRAKDRLRRAIQELLGEEELA